MDNSKLIKEESSQITLTKFDIAAACEGGGEYTMPDYYPAIRKIVSCAAQALPDTKFLSGDTLEHGGTLAFTVLYIGEDGALVALPYTCEYSGSQQLPSEVRGTAEIAVDAKAEDIQCRVLAPRKISLRARIKARISAFERVSCQLDMSTVDGGDISMAERATVQILCHSISTMRCGRGNATGTVSGEVREKMGAKPVSCSAAVNITEVKCQRDSITVRGEAVVRCIVFTKDGSYAPSRARLPFEEHVTADGCAEGDMCRAWGRAASVSVSEGDDGALKAEIEYDLDAEWCRKIEATITDDAYSTGWHSNIERTDIAALSPLCCTFSSLSLSGNGKRTTRPEAGEYLIDMTCDAAIEKSEQKDSHMIFSGSCTVKAYIASNGEVICEEFSLPLRFEAAAASPASTGDIITRASICCTDINGRLEGDTVSTNIELCLSLSCRREQMIHPASKIMLDRGAPTTKDAAQIKVFYPAENETIWDISKKYQSPVERIEKINDLPRTKNANGKAILIPVGLG